VAFVDAASTIRILGGVDIGDVVGLIARIVIGGTFLVAGFAKLRMGPAWPRQAAGMGVSRPVALPVPWVELGIGAAAIIGLASPWPAIAAAVMLVVFTVLIVKRLSEGVRPPCACFGARVDQPLGAGHVVRNAVLLIVAVVAAVLG